MLYYRAYIQLKYFLTDMWEKNQLSFGNRFLLFVLLSIILSSCTSDPGPELPNVTFDYSGSISGSFRLFHQLPDTASVLYAGLGDHSIGITAIRWADGHTRGDFFSFSFHSDSALSTGKVFSSDSLTSFIQGEMGFNVPIALHKVGNSNVLFISDSSGFQIIKLTFTLSRLSNLPTNYQLEGSFSAKCLNSKGDTIYVSNGFFNNSDF
jgi:hypothetical protein